MHWNNSDKFFRIFQLIFTLVIVDGKPLELKYVSWPHFPSLSHVEALICCKNLFVSVTERAEAGVTGSQVQAVPFGNEGGMCQRSLQRPGNSVCRHSLNLSSYFPLGLYVVPWYVAMWFS